jgi:hypothetical protein
MASRDDLNTGLNRDAIGARDWSSEESYWKSNFSSRPYARADRGFDYYSPAYRYGYESANQYRGRQWNDVETDLRSGWDRYEHRGQSTWENVKDAVKDAWNRVTGGGDTSTDRGTSRSTY